MSTITIYLLDYSSGPQRVNDNSQTFNYLTSNGRVTTIEPEILRVHLNNGTLETNFLRLKFSLLAENHKFTYLKCYNRRLITASLADIRISQTKIYLMLDELCPLNCNCSISVTFPAESPFGLARNNYRFGIGSPFSGLGSNYRINSSSSASSNYSIRPRSPPFSNFLTPITSSSNIVSTPPPRLVSRPSRNPTTPTSPIFRRQNSRRSAEPANEELSPISRFCRPSQPPSAVELSIKAIDTFILLNKSQTEMNYQFMYDGSLSYNLEGLDADSIESSKDLVNSFLWFMESHKLLDPCQFVTISYKNQSGMDYGGISRDFFYRFEKGLAHYRFKNHPLFDEKGRLAIPDYLFNPFKEVWFPYALGRVLIYIILQKISFPSNLFDREWFNLLLSLSKSFSYPQRFELDEKSLQYTDCFKWLKKNSPFVTKMMEDCIDFSAVPTPLSNFEETVREYCELKGIHAEQILTADDAVEAWVLYETFPNPAFLQNFLLGFDKEGFAKEFSERGKIDNLLSYLFFSEQNPWSANNLLKLINFKPQKFEGVVVCQQIARVKTWLLNCLKSSFSKEEREQFVWFATGNNRPHFSEPNPKIFVVLVGQRDGLSLPYSRFPVAQTCTLTINICFDYSRLEEQQFINDLKEAINQTSYGFHLV